MHADERSAIFGWLQDVHSDDSSGDELSGPTTPAKRRRLASADALADGESGPTPRRAAERPSRLPAAWQRLETSSAASAASARSGGSSPRKKMALLSLLPGGVERRSLEHRTRGLPAALAAMLKEIDMVSLGYGVISRDRLAEVEEEASMEPFPDFVFSEPSVRDSLGQTPAVADVLDLLNEAKWCFETGQAGHGWNCAIHYRLIRLGLHGPRRQEQLVDCTPCASARIIKEYLPANADTKLVDFAIYLRPEHDDTEDDGGQAARALRALRSVAPELSASHTGMEPLKEGPITVSIKTKRSGDGSDKAELQTGTWHAAQWNMLAAQTERAGGSLRELPLLPCLIVHGHDWSFAASSREGNKTILWVERPFGSTKSVLGIYKVLYGLQLLSRWSRDSFWPWYKQNILALGLLRRTVARSTTASLSPTIIAALTSLSGFK